MSYTATRGRFRGWWLFSLVVSRWLIALVVSVVHLRAGASLQAAAFQAIVLKPSLPEAPFNLRPPDTHGRTSHPSAAQIEALSTYLESLQT